MPWPLVCIMQATSELQYTPARAAQPLHKAGCRLVAAPAGAGVVPVFVLLHSPEGLSLIPAGALHLPPLAPFWENAICWANHALPQSTCRTSFPQRLHIGACGALGVLEHAASND